MSTVIVISSVQVCLPLIFMGSLATELTQDCVDFQRKQVYDNGNKRAYSMWQ